MFCPSKIVIYVLFSFFRLARGSILASIIRIMPGGPLRVVALYVSGVFVAFYVVTVAQIVWVCEMNVQLNKAGSVPLYLPHFAMNGSPSECHGA
jgi:hypothetical protein